MMTNDTPKKQPGDFVLGTNLQLFIVTASGSEVPHEQPHRRMQREAAERRRGWIYGRA